MAYILHKIHGVLLLTNKKKKKEKENCQTLSGPSLV
jgi:hypothetical protein